MFSEEVERLGRLFEIVDFRPMCKASALLGFQVILYINEQEMCIRDSREGELIFRLVVNMAGCQKPIFRLWISSMEDSAIREGFENLEPGSRYEPLYQSALCRSKADWLIGINATCLLYTSRCV